ncbi:hypothetical protein ACWEOI_14945 [Nocardia sp. NPDC004340]
MTVDPVVVEAGTAVVKLMATDVWSGAKNVVVGWWRKHHPEQAEQVGAELDQLHDEVIDAEIDDDTRDALAGEWRLRFKRLLATDPALAAELRHLLAEELAPMLAGTNQTATLTQTATVKGSRNTTIQGRW